MNSEARKKMALDLLEACDSGDVERALALVSDDFHSQFMEAPADSSLSGDAAQPMRMNRAQFAASGIPLIRNVTLDGMHFVIDDVLCEGENAVVFGRSDAIMRSGKVYKNIYAWKFKFSADRISEMLEYCDTKRARELLAG
jgi:ketosteroid isomerase-like protein